MVRFGARLMPRAIARWVARALLAGVPVLVAGLIAMPLAWAAPAPEAGRDCRAAGCHFDGAPHPLGREATLAGRATAGWTLAQWRTLFPGATSLDDEVDGLVIQALYDAGPAPEAQAVVIRLPPGKGWSSRPIATCGASLRLEGAGSGNTILAFRAGVDGFHHCFGRSTQVSGAGLDLHGLLVSTAGLGATAIDATFGYGGIVPMQMNDVAFHGDGSYTTQGWATCGTLRNPGGMILRDVACTGVLNAPLTAVGDGFTVSSKAINGNVSAPVFDMQFYGVNINGFNTCLTFHSTTDQGIEGVVLHGLQCGGVRRCLQITTDVKTYYPPQYFIANIECETAAEVLRVDGASYLAMSDSLIYVNPPSAATGRPEPSALFALERTSNSVIHHNAIEVLPGARLRTIATLTNAVAVRFDDNLVKVDTGAEIAGPGFAIPAGTGSTGNGERSTTWLAWPADRPKVADLSADPTNVFASAVAGGVPFARLPALGNPDRPSILCSDCRKPGEARGAGTGMRVDDLGNGRWIDTSGAVASP